MGRLGIIGGTGLLELEGLEVRRRREDRTRWGAPSGPVLEGVLGGREVAFLHRHGTPSRIPPHRINYRANICALSAAGCDRIVAVAAVGGIRADLGPGTLVVPDQIVDYTWGRAHTFFEEDLDSPVHIDFSRPYDETLARRSRAPPPPPGLRSTPGVPTPAPRARGSRARRRSTAWSATAATWWG